MIHAEGYIPVECPARKIEIDYSARLARIEEKIESLFYEIKRSRADKYIFSVICSCSASLMAAIITYAVTK